ncbi:hypothetical protein [Granulicella sp. L60]|uniref:hypothetical protein n=1 Tax=Granulicella sp. L60 TaxID=1641866 RepID=UPI00131C58A6|nr:hypothetical protein [Granulicella sp. L60]
MRIAILRPQAQIVDPAASISQGSELRRRVTEEVQAMALYAMGAGLQLPTGVLLAYETHEVNVERLAQYHATLSRSIYPSTPRAVLELYREEKRHPRLSHLVPVSIMRHMLFVACLSTAVLLLCSLSPKIDQKVMQQDLIEGSGLTLLLSEIFLIASSAVGSSFAALFKLNRYVSGGTYDPRYVSSYWVQLVLGVISGLLLSKLFFHYLQKNHADLMTSSLNQPLLALMGGFSSSLVYRVLTRLLSAVESLFGAESAVGGISEQHPRRTTLGDAPVPDKA